MLNIDSAITELKERRPVIIFDNDNEMEGDLVYPAEIINVTILNFMLNHCKGVICQTLTKNTIDALGIPVFKKSGNTLTGQTNFVYPVDHKLSDTGISSRDREMIIKELISDDVDTSNIVIPGHQSLLKIADGGIYERQGHTESSSELVKLAGYTESAVICEIINDEGVPMRYREILAFSLKHDIKVIMLSDIFNNVTRTQVVPSVENIKNPYIYLNNKHVIITGGTSGIGYALKQRLAMYSCNLVDFSRSNGHDVTNFTELNQYIDTHISSVDIMVNCAGFIEPCSVGIMPLSTFQTHINTNLTSIVNLTTQLLPKFNPDGGVIINVSSPSADKIRPGWSAYCCSKAALNSYTLNCAKELESRNIHVNAVSPTKTDTPMIHRLFPDIDKEILIDPAVVANYIIDVICNSMKHNISGTIYSIQHRSTNTRITMNTKSASETY